MIHQRLRSPLPATRPATDSLASAADRVAIEITVDKVMGRA